MSGRIYMAGMCMAGRGEASTTNPNAMITANLFYPWMLESYHYIGPKWAALQGLRERKETIFLDSGAFSMFTLGVEVDLAAYAKFVKENADIIHVSSNIDAIGSGNEQKSYDNLAFLEQEGAHVQPVHHARDRDEWLERYISEGYDYIFLGGMVPESTTYLLGWLDHIWSKYLINPDGTAKVKIHGFGITNEVIMFRYPWFSVDSTAWNARARYGMVMLDLPGLREIDLHFSDQSAQQYKDNSWHFNRLRGLDRKRVLDRLEELEAERRCAPDYNPEVELWLKDKTGIEQGYNPEALATMTGWRSHFNIQYFARCEKRMVDRFIPEQGGLW